MTKALAVSMAGCALIALATDVLAQSGPVPVVVSVAAERLLAPVTSYPGTVISRNQARLAAEMDGRLEWVAEVGTVVTKGETVARLDEVLLAQNMLVDQAAVNRERARLKYQNAEVARLTPLVRKQSVPQSQLDEALSNRGMTEAEIAAGEARVALARERLKRANLRAPFDGIITERLLQAGEWAESGATIVRLVDISTLEVQTWVPVNTLDFVRQGSKLTLVGNPHTATGTVRTIVPVGDNRSRLYELRLTLGDGIWPVGADLRVAIPTSEARKVLTVPRDALVLRREGVSVYRIDAEGTAERISVEPGMAVGEFIEVDNLQSGDRVVIRGGERLRPGQSVTIMESAGKP